MSDQSAVSAVGGPLNIKGRTPQLQGSRFHLTYRGHIPLEEYPLEAASKWSFVHETSDNDHPYDHTHVLLWFKKRKMVTTKFFDHNGIHPNVQLVSTDQHWENTVKYHTKAPVFLKTSENLAITSYHEECIDWIQSRNNIAELWGKGPYSEYIASKHSWAEKCFNARPQCPNCKISEDTMYPWQKELLQMLKEQVEEVVIWIWDTPGRVGKTQMMHYLTKYHNAAAFTSTAYKEFALLYSNEPIAIFNLTRDHPEAVNYHCFECLNDGFIQSNKYVPTRKYFKPPHVVVFANNKPKTSALSEERWRIFEIKDTYSSLIPTSILPDFTCAT